MAGSASQVQIRRDTSANVAAYTGPQGELVADITNKRITYHDGSTAGGIPMAKLSETIVNTRTAVADANYTALVTDRTIAFTSLTAARTVTLLAASAYPTGTILWIMDESGSCSGTNYIAINRAGSDTIDGAASTTLNGAYQATGLQTNGSNKWTIIGRNPNESLTALGIGAPPDASNPLKVSATQSLFDSATNHIVQVNKAAAANNCGFQFQDNYSKRATWGLLGNDHLIAQVSPDGSTLYTAIDIDQNTGNVAFPVMIGGLKNRLINGNFNIWQRGTSFTVANNTAPYTADRFFVFNSGTGINVTVAQSAPASGMRGQNCMKITATSLTTSGNIQVTQRFESQMFADLDSQPCVLSFDINASASAGTVGAYLYLSVNTAPDNGTFSTNLVAGQSITLPSPGVSGKVSIALTPSQTNGIKNGGQLFILFTQNGSTGNPTIYLGSVQFEAGSVANPFEFRPQGLELAMCQRYFSKSYSAATAPGTAVGAGNHGVLLSGASATPFGFSQTMPVTMRATPTITIYDGAGASGSMSYWNGAAWTNGGAIQNQTVTDRYFQSQYTGAASIAVGYDWTANAEL